MKNVSLDGWLKCLSLCVLCRKMGQQGVDPGEPQWRVSNAFLAIRVRPGERMTQREQLDRKNILWRQAMRQARRHPQIPENHLVPLEFRIYVHVRGAPAPECSVPRIQPGTPRDP